MPYPTDPDTGRPDIHARREILDSDPLISEPEAVQFDGDPFIEITLRFVLGEGTEAHQLYGLAEMIERYWNDQATDLEELAQRYRDRELAEARAELDAEKEALWCK